MDKIIMHVDVNSAFLSWSAADRILNHNELVDLRDICSVVGGDQESRHGIVLAKSIPAKKCKIQTGEPLVSARQKCPELVVVPPDYRLYVEASEAFVKLLQRYCPKIEQYSIDEVWVDVTGTTSLYGSPVLFAEFLNRKIASELGFTVNIGVSCNKLLAKMGSELKKPNMVHTLFPGEIEEKMWPLPVRELFFVGRATEKKLLALGIKTIGDIAKTDIEILKLHLKKHGEVIHSFACGNGEYLDNLIVTQQSENKGYGNSMTLPFDFNDDMHIDQAILSLSETLGQRLRKDNVKIKCISISITNSDFNRVGHQCQLYSETDITEEIYLAARRIFHEIWDKSPVRQLGVHTSKVAKGSTRQYNLFDLDRFDKQEKLNGAIDQIREKYGKNSIMRACFVQHNSLKHMSGGISDEKLTGITKPLSIAQVHGNAHSCF